MYHPDRGGLLQAEQVFLRGNDLPQRWRGRQAFTVCETGFGLGLNFLALWRAWRDDDARAQRLHVVSIEAHPFSRDDLAELLKSLVPEALRDQAEQLLAAWPLPLPGLHRLTFEGGRLTLTLAFGLAHEMAPQLQARVDAYFLDGFMPARNPAMWEPALLARLSRLAAPDATVATWASAGAVRRALADCGFTVKKVPGFGGKWHGTVAHRAVAGEGGLVSAEADALASVALAGTPRSAALAGSTVVPTRALVIGAGVAGAGVAHALALRGWDVTVMDDAMGERAGHHAAALTPLIDRDDTVRARLARAGAQRAWAVWQGLGESAAHAGSEDHPAAVAWRCGTVQVARARVDPEALQAAVVAQGLPAAWVAPVTREMASDLAGLPVARAGLYFPGGLRVKPGRLCEVLLSTPGITVQPAQVASLRRTGDGSAWEALALDGRVLASAPVVVLAAAAGVPGLLARSGLPAVVGMGAIAGQISLLPAQALTGGGPRCVVSGEGYLLPAEAGWCVAGSTYVHDAAQAKVTTDGHAANVARVQALVPGLAGNLDPAGLRGWAGWRAVLPGRLPAIGPWPGADGLWLATGYASRGLTWSALAGDVIAAALSGEPQPVAADLLGAVSPARVADTLPAI